MVTRRRGQCSAAGRARPGLRSVTTLSQVVDPYQMGDRGSQYGQKGEVHNERPGLLSPPGPAVRLQEGTDGGGQLRVPAGAPGLHPGRPPGRLRLLCCQSDRRAVDHLETGGRRGGGSLLSSLHDGQVGLSQSLRKLILFRT